MTHTLLACALSSVFVASTIAQSPASPSRGVDSAATPLAATASAQPGNGPADDDGAASPAPEPATILLVGTGLILLALSSRRWRRTLMPNS